MSAVPSFFFLSAYPRSLADYKFLPVFIKKRFAAKKTCFLLSLRYYTDNKRRVRVQVLGEKCAGRPSYRSVCGEERNQEFYRAVELINFIASNVSSSCSRSVT